MISLNDVIFLCFYAMPLFVSSKPGFSSLEALMSLNINQKLCLYISQILEILGKPVHPLPPGLS